MGGGWNRGLDCVDWSEKIRNRTNGQFELVDKVREPNSSAKLVIRCSKCGTEKRIADSSIRGTNTIKCVNCYSEECRTLREEKEAREKKAKAETIMWDTLQRRQKSEYQMTFNTCEECGQFIRFRARFCEACRKKHEVEAIREQSRRADIRRRARLRNVKRDKDLTKEKLYERDKGICYLCGRLCDWNDGKWENGIFKVGKTYPTVEHLIPIVSGGSDTWDNVKLACVSCNSKKGTKILENISPWG